VEKDEIFHIYDNQNEFSILGGRKSPILISLPLSPTIIHMKVSMNIKNKYELSLKWIVHHGTDKSTMKLSKTCMIVV
jgi:hypothetical protein